MKRTIGLMCAALALGCSLAGCIIVPERPYGHYHYPDRYEGRGRW